MAGCRSRDSTRLRNPPTFCCSAPPAKPDAPTVRLELIPTTGLTKVNRAPSAKLASGPAVCATTSTLPVLLVRVTSSAVTSITPWEDCS
ncbi:hypothetical protein D9M69_329670 [compost metagenome]